MRPVDFYLYFPERSRAEDAIRSLEGRGYSVTLRPGADGSWLALASKPVPSWQLAVVERRLTRLAARLSGEYDGYERDVASAR